MYVDGERVAAAVAAETAALVRQCDPAPHGTLLTCAPTPVTERYLARKQEQADHLGIHLSVHREPGTASTEDLVAALSDIAPSTDAIVVQLPLPAHIDTDAVLAAVPPERDVDGLAPHSPFRSPVVGAIAAIAEEYGITVAGKRAVVLGAGRLVGRPAAAWLREQGASVTVVTAEEANPEAIRAAEIIVTGVGKPHLVQPDMIAPGVVIFDAGTSESGGELCGDVAPACAGVASYLTPVPGGIGPITIAVLMQNIAHAALRER